MKALWKKPLRLFALAMAVIGVFIIGISGYVGWNLTHPPRKALQTTPAVVGLSYEPVSFVSRQDGLDLQGWLLRAPENRLTVICSHGYRQNREQADVPLLPLAKVLVEHGMNVLLFDYRNSGESAGQMTSVGQYEVRDLLGAVDYVHSRQDLNPKVALLGFSMGAATAILAGAAEPSIAAVVADAPFADLTRYLETNFSVWTGLPAVPFNRTILAVTPILTGLQPEKVSPVQVVGEFAGRPLLLIHGEADEDIAPENSWELQQAYPAAELMLVAGARHVKSYQQEPMHYEAALLNFLRKVEIAH
ncbi:alpha/beta hydrolase [Anaeromusa acidaminophila]|uniref:alpha/beta hydrolase n=1 Tax=Anaeromusa acidaminophila TaxID=81464 RepID=UPI00036AEEE5|nr:alpha/beta fold hydrolase [Anaeromusa acidaminophila]